MVIISSIVNGVTAVWRGRLARVPGVTEKFAESTHATLARVSTTRRRFLGQCAAAAAGAYVGPALARAASAPSVHFPSEPRQRIAVASYPFREFIAGPEHKAGNPTIELKDFAAHVIEKFNVNKIEPWTGHFPSRDAKYLEQFRASVEKAKAAIANIAVDGEHSPYATDRSERRRAIGFDDCNRRHAVTLASGSGMSFATSLIERSSVCEPSMPR